MSADLQTLTQSFATSQRDFSITNSDVNAYCINKHFYYPPHRHQFHFDLVYVAEGKLVQRINGRKIELLPGDMILVRPDDWHEESGHGMHFYVICCTVQWMESLMGFMQTMEAHNALMKMPDPPRAHAPGRFRENLQSRWERCWQVQLGTMGPSHAFQLASELFVSFFLPQVEHVMQHKSYPLWFRRAMNYIQEHVGEEISSETLSDVCEKSPEHIARSFQHFMNSTPSQYINRTRIHYASRLLITTSIPIIEIAMTAGFGSLGHFYRLFKKRFHYSPRAFRLKHHQNAGRIINLHDTSYSESAKHE